MAGMPALPCTAAKGEENAAGARGHGGTGHGARGTGGILSRRAGMPAMHMQKKMPPGV
jgi:hypothetical protein